MQTINKLFLTFIFLFFAIPSTLLASTEVSGTITGNATWTISGSPYIVSDTVSVPAGNTLTIEPGVIVKFSWSFASLDIEGTLNALGTSESPIFLTSYKDDTVGGDTNGDGSSSFPAFGNWRGIIFYPGSVGDIANASIRFGGQFFCSLGCFSFPMVRQDGASLTLDNVILRPNTTLADAIGQSDGNTTITDSQIGGARSGIVVSGGTIAINNSVVTGTNYALRNNTANTIEAINNWWGDSSGPSHENNPDGNGDRIFGDVSFSPWLLNDPTAPIVTLNQAITPSVGTASSTLIFKVVYTNSFNQAPESVRMVTVGDNSNAPCILTGGGGGGVLSMFFAPVAYASEGDGCEMVVDTDATAILRDGNYSNGEQYILSTEFPAGNFTYYFESGNINSSDYEIVVSEEVSCTINCNSSVMFLPGVMGSRLFEDDNERWVSIFDSDHERLKLDENGKSINNLYTKEVDGVIDDAYSANIYQSFMNSLYDWKNGDNLIADYALVPYDWRLSLDDILENGATTTGGKIFYGTNQGFQNSYIYKKLKELQLSSRTGKVTIVAHSNGGLVAKALIQKLKEVNDSLYDSIDNLILVAVPQSGTPDAINILLHGDNIGKGFIMETARMRDMSHNMPGAYQLLPSLAYWNGEGSSVQTPVVTFESGVSTQSFIDTYGISISDATTLRRFLLDEGEGRPIPSYKDLNNPSRLNGTLLSNARDAHALIDDAWFPSASTTIYQIAGWGEETLATLKYKTLSKCVTAEWKIVGWKLLYECLSWKNTLTIEPDKFVDGDGVVVTPSALAMSTSSPNVKRLWVNLQKYDTIFNYEREHRDILEIPDIGGFIKNTISTTTLKTYEFIENSEPLAGSTKRLSFILHSPLDLIIRDSNGNEVSSTTESIPGGRYKRYGEVQYISVPEDSNPRLFLQGISSGSFDLDIKESVGNNIVATTTFASIPSATSTTVSMLFTDGTIENASVLSIDYQGDGQVDETIEPVVGETVTLPPLDLIAPEGRVIFSTSTDSVGINGFDDKTLIPVIISTATSSTITDETGNVIKLTRTIKNNKNNALFVLSKLEYSTSTKTNVVISATSNYLWLKNPKSTAYLVFASFLKTSTESLVSVYDSVKKKTIIYSLPKDMTSVDINNFVLKPLKGAVVKTMVNGMIIPYLETNKGQVLIKY
jgi:pimeloyl-ACP methyl ester carboxylesterase